MKPLLLPLFVGLLLTGCTTRPPLQTVPSVDLNRYAGTWHEIARYPNWFQRHCHRRVTAEYRPANDGSLTVRNACLRRNGSRDSVKGRATVVPGTGNARLKVSFGDPFAGDYQIIGLDPDYQWALVGHPSRRYLWILARQPKISDTLYHHMVQLAVDQGYKADRIRRTDP